MQLPDEFVLYAHWYEGTYKSFWNHIYNHPSIVALCDSQCPIHKLIAREVREGEQSEYWGWWTEGKLAMVYCSRPRFDICFPYGTDSEIAKGRGVVVNLLISSTERISP